MADPVRLPNGIEVIIILPGQALDPCGYCVWRIEIKGTARPVPFGAMDFWHGIGLPELLESLPDLLRCYIDSNIVDEHWPEIEKAMTVLYVQYHAEAA